MPLLKTYKLYLNSEQATQIVSGRTDYVKWTLKNKILLSHPHNHFKVRILSAVLPYSFYQFPTTVVSGFYTHNAGNNFFSFTIPEGNYDILTLQAQFKTLLEAVTHPHQWTFNFTYDGSYGFASFAFTSSQDFIFTFAYNANLWKAFGFAPTETFVFGNNPATVKTSSRHCVVHQVHTLHIRSDTLNQITGNQEAIVEPIDYSDILTEILLYTSPNSYIQFERYDNVYVQINNPAIDVIQLYITNNITFSVSLNLDWIVTLEINEHSPDEKPAEVASTEDKDNAIRLLADLREGLLQELNQNRQDLLGTM